VNVQTVQKVISYFHKTVVVEVFVRMMEDRFNIKLDQASVEYKENSFTFNIGSKDFADMKGETIIIAGEEVVEIQVFLNYSRRR
jgi:hypothetical protein